jgi:hypothetical protein
VLVIGSAIEPPTEPVVLARRPEGARSDNVMGCLEAPVTSPSTAEAVGHARLCHDGHTLQVTLRVTGLVPGEVYSLWLGYAHQLEPCQASLCGHGDLPHERSTGLLQQVVGEGSPGSGALQVDSNVHDVQLVRGARLSLLLLCPCPPVEPHAQATFVVP